MKAVILAAGTGLRSSDVPKALLPVAGVPILRRTITSLLRFGFDQLVIGTGYHEQAVRDAVAEWFPGLDVTFVTNPEFRTTGTAYSLHLARKHVDGRAFMLLDGDVVFDLGVIEELIEHGPDCLAVRSEGELGLEEMKVTADREDRVLQIGKHVPVRSAMGESIGLALFSAATSKRLFTTLASRIENGLVHEFYESAFQQLVDEGRTFYGVDIGSLYACEIDTNEDLVQANKRLAERPAFDVAVDIRLAV